MKPLPGMHWHSIDPGVEYYAVAVWCGAALVAADVVPIGYHMDPVELVVIEKPQIYGDKERARKSDVADLLWSGGRIADRYDVCVPYLPAEWKGQIPKNVHHARIAATLSANEAHILTRMPKKKLVHVLDAIGIGLYHLSTQGIRR